MLFSRRKLIIGAISVVAAPAIVRIENIMSVRALVVPIDDPLVFGIKYQSWPLKAARPYFFATGSFSSTDGKPKPLSSWLKSLEGYSTLYPDIAWEPLPKWYGASRAERNNDRHYVIED